MQTSLQITDYSDVTKRTGIVLLCRDRFQGHDGSTVPWTVKTTSRQEARSRLGFPDHSMARHHRWASSRRRWGHGLRILVATLDSVTAQWAPTGSQAGPHPALQVFVVSGLALQLYIQRQPWPSRLQAVASLHLCGNGHCHQFLWLPPPPLLPPMQVPCVVTVSTAAAGLPKRLTMNQLSLMVSPACPGLRRRGKISSLQILGFIYKIQPIRGLVFSILHLYGILHYWLTQKVGGGFLSG